MAAEPLKLLILGAHPDDAEFHAGGLAAAYRALGHAVKMVSVTNGAAGHHHLDPATLAQVRRQEAAAAGGVIGAVYEVWDYSDGELLPTLELRRQIIRELRTFAPQLVLTHRTNDYHPDHRAVGQAVQDASYMVTVPLIVRDAPALPRDPVVAFLPDLFTRPCPLRADAVLDISPHLDTIVAMLACHRSQFFEWLPHHDGLLDQVPAGDAERIEWLRGWFAGAIRARADRYRGELAAAYGQERGAAIQWAEVYEISEYARQPDEAELRRLFPRD